MPSPKKSPVPKKDAADVTEEFERLLKGVHDGQRYVLKLFVSGSSPRSTQAISTIRALCEERLQGRYDLEVVDIFQQPTEARGSQIVAAPTLIKELPEPMRRVVGNLADRDKILVALNLKDAPQGSTPTWAKI
ncbi:circadian clock protein KaiB [Roseimicrobium gellanilyticum]|uniref:Circadian clock protein KaiB n=1 Tax=Roseimicrobium gellanilyticum TaxID=748857 RepID=A0A366HTD5_9BACT|nr:circadian clock KaiB family protein [Roseimicrobium gellanilyticum]RBP46358.1 circadian clock protein KaiB [Roseimicrobium gellanilyticum]